ncbi:hypothetical protein GCM10012286_16830 [Streptomyces lasiicapitis]|uniref:Uncharacterized protein n=1 Tax=Streptomyces lasiicapitis TaxID=1923961 RepID=A0ABQ2LMH4_9ACTN|nr:hypothetical protein GCM10012286_16830 [Streptomyces lasiicapitis]
MAARRERRRLGVRWVCNGASGWGEFSVPLSVRKVSYQSLRMTYTRQAPIGSAKRFSPAVPRAAWRTPYMAGHRPRRCLTLVRTIPTPSASAHRAQAARLPREG